MTVNNIHNLNEKTGISGSRFFPHFSVTAVFLFDYHLKSHDLSDTVITAAWYFTKYT